MFAPSKQQARAFLRRTRRCDLARERDRQVAIPNAHNVARLARAVYRRFPGRTLQANRDQAVARKASNALAAEMRRRGWLYAEGYAPNSWAAP